MTREEILGYFKDMDLNEEQQQMVLDFLLKPHPEDEKIAENAEDPQDDNAESGEDETDDEKKESYQTESMDAADAEKNNEAAHPGVFQMYLDELNELSTYSKEKQEEMYKALLAGDESVINDITNCWLPVVLENAKKLTESNDPDSLQDVVQEGNMALFMRLMELCGSQEKIDVVEYSKDLVQFIKNALSPAKDVEVYILDDKKSEALAVAEGDNLSLAIGKKGQNVKLAARLTKCKIDVKTREQVQEEGINIYKYYEA